MAVELVDGVHWLPRCHEVDGRHLHVSVYLIEGADGYVLVDTGARGDDSIREEVEALTEAAGVDTVVFTHSSLPHTGNAAVYHAEGARIVSATSLLAEMGMAYAEEWLIDEEPEICGRRFSFVKPVFSDHVFSQWVVDHEAGVLFPSETFGNYHDPGECALTWDDLADGITEADVDEYCRDRLPGMAYVLPETLEAALRARLDAYDVRYVAPSHGNPIPGDRVDEYVDRLLDVASRFAEDWDSFTMNE